MLLSQFPAPPTRIMFFTGKGGVGKTTTACATAIALAAHGKKVLLVCTDPASNLSDVLGTEINETPRPIPGAAGLFAINIDPQEAARAYRERVVGPYRGVLPEAALASIEEQLSGACTTEIAAFDEFVKLLGDDAATGGFDHVIFDTAPTGHTLRLLELPAAWSQFIDTNTSGTSCLGPLSGLNAQRALYREAMTRLCDRHLTTLVLVSTAQESPLAEAARSSAELAAQGIANQLLVINGLFTVTNQADAVAVALASEQAQALAAMPGPLHAMPRINLAMQPEPLLGVEALRRFAEGRSLQATASGTSLPAPSGFADLDTLIGSLAKRGHGVIMTMGKGGVGKTSLATAIAVALAKKGFAVHLSTTDPAAHLNLSLASIVANLSVSVIDPEVETRRYQDEVVAEKGSDLDEAGKKLLEEDLRSPCTEEIAVFGAFARKVEMGRDGFVVLDTAPTGHTLLLLDATESYHREVSRSKSALPEAVTALLPRLRDPEFTSVFIVALPEATPVAEATMLQEDLRRAGIEPAGWIINRSLTPLTVSDPLLMTRRAAEFPHLERVIRELTRFVVMIPWRADAG